MSYPAPFGLGKTWSGESETIDVSSSYANSPAQHLEGRECNLVDSDVATMPTNPRSGDIRKTRIVRNCSGVTLKGGYAVTYSTPLKRVNGYARVTAEKIAGFVDPLLGTTGVRDGDLFHLVVEGYVLTKTPASGSDFVGDIAVGDPLFALTSAAANATTTTQLSIAGRLRRQPASHSAADTTDTASTNYAGLFARNVAAYAASAATTGQTNSDILVVVNYDY